MQAHVGPPNLRLHALLQSAALRQAWTAESYYSRERQDKLETLPTKAAGHYLKMHDEEKGGEKVCQATCHFFSKAERSTNVQRSWKVLFSNNYPTIKWDNVQCKNKTYTAEIVGKHLISE